MYEIIADPQDYGIEDLVNGLSNDVIDFEKENREKWAREVKEFATKLEALAAKAKDLQSLFGSEQSITATPASLKTLKIQLFKINDAVNQAFHLANRIENEIIIK